MQNWLVSSKTLQEMAHLSLEKRTELIKIRYNLDSLSTWPLWKFYLHHDITYRLSYYCYSRKMLRGQELNTQQQEAVKKLAAMLMDDRHVIYVDETFVHKWYSPLTWAR